MERATWTDDRIDDLVDRLDTTIERLDRTLQDFREDMRGMREDMNAGFRETRNDSNGVRRQVLAVALGTNGLLGAALIALAAHAF